jgi:hypothetical protein
MYFPFKSAHVGTALLGLLFSRPHSCSAAKISRRLLMQASRATGSFGLLAVWQPINNNAMQPMTELVMMNDFFMCIFDNAKTFSSRE